jgi:ferredoxin
VDENVCIGSGNCEDVCPRVFKVIGGVSKVQADPVPPEEEDRAREAVDGCPVSAISVEE